MDTFNEQKLDRELESEVFKLKSHTLITIPSLNVHPI